MANELDRVLGRFKRLSDFEELDETIRQGVGRGVKMGKVEKRKPGSKVVEFFVNGEVNGISVVDKSESLPIQVRPESEVKSE